MEDNLMIYHYCAIDSVLPIIQSKALWMSDITKMNDPLEYSLGFTQLESVFSDIFPEHVNWLKYRNTMNSNMILSTSFSKQPDVLSQWRAYSSDGGGIAVGFCEKDILSINQYTKAEAVNYNENSIREIARELIVNHPYNKSSFAMKGFNTTDLNLANKLSELATFYKSDFYEEEQEIRIVRPLNTHAIIETIKRPQEVIDDTKVNYRNSQYGLIPYVNLYFTNNETIAIKEIIIGPKSKFSKIDLEFLLAYNGLHNVEIKKSKGSYR